MLDLNSTTSFCIIWHLISFQQGILTWNISISHSMSAVPEPFWSYDLFYTVFIYKKHSSYACSDWTSIIFIQWMETHWHHFHFVLEHRVMDDVMETWEKLLVIYFKKNRKYLYCLQCDRNIHDAISTQKIPENTQLSLCLMLPLCIHVSTIVQKNPYYFLFVKISHHVALSYKFSS